MKKWIALLTLLCVLFTMSTGLAAEGDYGPDNPFLPGVDYSKPYRDYGAVPAQLNFGKVKVADVQRGNTDSAKTVDSMSTTEMMNILMGDDEIFYVFAKHQTSKSVPRHTVNTMLVLQDPYGNNFTSYDVLNVAGTGSGYRYSGLSKFFDVEMSLYRVILHNGELPKGEYIITMYYDNKFFRSTSFVLY